MVEDIIEELMEMFSVRTNMKIEFINVWFKKNRLMNVKVGILGLNFFGKNDIITSNKKPVQVSVKLKMREKCFILHLNRTFFV